jgi:Methyltransferase domain
MAACERAAYFRDEIAPEPAETLAALGVALKVVNRESCDAADGLIPALLDTEETKFLVALAPEMTVKADFFEWIGDTSLAAQRAPGDRFDLEALKAAREAFGISFVLYDTRALFVRRDIARALGAEWTAALREVRRLLVREKNLPVAAAESVALGVALSKLPIEIRELPAAGPVVCAAAEIMSENVVDLVRISRHFNLDFDNALFWNDRYLADPRLGSGLGSRAAPRALKTALIRHTLERERSHSVLDVGCGDLASVVELPITDYTGIDIAETVIKANAARRRSWKFFAGDFLKLYHRHYFRADLVLCFDVLIHQHDFASYEAFVRAIVASCKGIGLVGAFQSPPRPLYRSEITAYHEPITRTLVRCGVKEMRIVANYRDTVVVEFAHAQSLCI